MELAFVPAAPALRPALSSGTLLRGARAPRSSPRIPLRCSASLPSPPSPAPASSTWTPLPASAVPAWMRKRHITTGYRPPHLPYRTLLASAFRLHNETFNIWSHLLASLTFLALALTPLTPAPASALTATLLRAYPLAAATTFATSATYHTFSPRSHAAHTRLRALDFQSILLLITASYLPALHLAYCAHAALHRAYLALSLAALPASSLGVALAHRADNMPAKNAFLVGSALWGIVPTLHALHPAANVPRASMFLQGTAVMWALYAVGFVVYAARVPEKYVRAGREGRRGLDLFGASHHWWHVFTTLAAASWFVFLGRYYPVSAAAGAAVTAVAR